MKKFVKAGMLMIAVVVILAMRGFTVKADGEKYDNPKELYSEWATHDTYPENFTGAWIEDNKFYIGMTNDDAGHAEADAVVALLSDSDSVTIVYQKYKFRYLKDVMQELVDKMGEHGVMSFSIREDKNYVIVWLSEYASKQEQTDLRNELEKKYGDAVFVMAETAGYDAPTANNKEASHTTRNAALLAVLIIGVVAITVAVTARVLVPVKGTMLYRNSDNNETKTLNEQIKETSEKTTKQFDAFMLEEIEKHYNG